MRNPFAAPDETHGAALQRELREDLGVEVDVAERVYQTLHAYPDRTVELYFYRCSLKSRARRGRCWDRRCAGCPGPSCRRLGFHLPIRSS